MKIQVNMKTANQMLISPHERINQCETPVTYPVTYPYYFQMGYNTLQVHVGMRLFLGFFSDAELFSKT